MIPRRLHYTLCIYFSLFLAVGCNNRDSAEEHDANEHNEEQSENVVELTEAQAKNADIQLGYIEQKRISGTIKANGVLDVPPQQLVSISVPLGGFLKSTALLQGSRVKKGQVIATIENMDFIQLQQDYVEAKSQFELAKADYERQLELAKENVNSQKVLQQSKTHFTIWQGKYTGLREKLKMINVDVSAVEEGRVTSYINLFSPITGYVTEVNVNIGKFVSPTDVLFEIVDTEHLHAELIVFEKDVRKIAIGQKVRFTLANEKKERNATIYLIGREIGPDRTLRIHCHINEEDKEFLPGMYLTAVVETGGALVPALPNEAVLDYQGKKYIFLMSEEGEGNNDTEEKDTTSVHGPRTNSGSKHFLLQEVQTANSELGFTEVLVPDSIAHLPVVVKGAYSLLAKMKNSEEEGGHGHAH